MTKPLYGETFKAAEFEATRYRTRESLDRWCEQIGAWFEVSIGQRRVLDLGAGTGIWAETIAGRFDIEVVGVEPGAGMLPVAAGRRHPLVAFVAGTAEAIPLADGSVTSAWMSTVIHHFKDLDATAGELRRVVAPKGPLLIRNWFADRLDSNELIRHFPTARRRMEGGPALAEVVTVFERHGFAFAGVEAVPEPDRTYDEALAALPRERKIDSCLVLIGDEEWEAGLANIRRLRDRGDTPTPFHLDLLAFH